MVEEESGEHFDPAIVDAFLACYEDFLRVSEGERVERGDLVGVAMSSDVRR